MAGRYWLFKSEPSAYSFDDLVRDGVAEWDGVRNFQVRNWIRDDIKVGDGVLFYHSSSTPLGVVGSAQVVREAYPDHTAWDPSSEHPDPKSTPEKPLWYMVDIKHVRTFKEPLTLEELRTIPQLQEMVLLQKGSRLSVHPVAPKEFALISKLRD